MAKTTGLKWRKDPKPELLAQLPEIIRTEGVAVLRQMAPYALGAMRARLRQGYYADEKGEVKRMPPYTEEYKAHLHRMGEDSGTPDFEVSGAMLDSLKPRIWAVNQALELRITPGGAINPSTFRRRQWADGNATQAYHAAYSYVNGRGQTVSVPGHWQERSKASKEAYQKHLWAVKKDSKLRYNSHLANIMSKRLGGGKWGGFGSRSFLNLSREELSHIGERWKDKVLGPAARMLATVAGK